jgi:hypothetical protein
MGIVWRLITAGSGWLIIVWEWVGFCTGFFGLGVR